MGGSVSSQGGSHTPDDDLLERLFEEALALPLDQRDAFLDDACPSDPELKEEVKSLLEASLGAEAFLEDVGRLVPAGSVADPPPGLVAGLSDRYRIDGRLGQGGMATVFGGLDLRHGRRVAIKVLKPEVAAVVGAQRFLGEIRTTANLQHPNILPLFDSGEVDGHLFYVMPFVDGESLRERLERESQLAVDEAVRITISLAEALDYAHRQGVVHRDLKPGNVLLLDGKPVLADFGIAWPSALEAVTG